MTQNQTITEADLAKQRSSEKASRLLEMVADELLARLAGRQVEEVVRSKDEFEGDEVVTITVPPTIADINAAIKFLANQGVQVAAGTPGAKPVTNLARKLPFGDPAARQVS